jgi:hypothetical protein
MLALPPCAIAQEPGAETAEAETTKTFKKEELDQMLAPIALYPDSLLAPIRSKSYRLTGGPKRIRSWKVMPWPRNLRSRNGILA